MRALTGKAIVWTLQPGSQHLKKILCLKIKALSRKRWGLDDYTWVFAPNCHTLLVGELEVWYNMCKLWNTIKTGIKKALQPCVPANYQERDWVPIWSPHLGHSRTTSLGGKSVTQQRLIGEGMVLFRHISDVDSWATPILGQSRGKSIIIGGSKIMQMCIRQFGGNPTLDRHTLTTCHQKPKVYISQVPLLEDAIV